MNAAVQERTLPIPTEHREFTVKVDGQVVPREHQLLALNITSSVNKIAAARLVYLDGTGSGGDFPLSNTDLFKPGNEVEIAAGAVDDPVAVFKGIVVRQNIKIRDQTAPQLIVECRHVASKLTVGRKNAYFFDQTDADIISQLLQNHGISAEVDATNVTHKQVVQYYTTDWDFIVTRAESNGKFVLTGLDGVNVMAPSLDDDEVCVLQFGATILEMDAQVDSRVQYDAVKSLSWDPAQQSVISVEASDPGVTTPGNLTSSDLAAAMGLEHWQLQHAAITQEEAQAWADAHWFKSQLARVSGRVKCEGIASVKTGDVVKLGGVGERYNGKVWVSGVRHDFDTQQGWKTHIQFGNTEAWLAEEQTVTSAQASALLPGINGLQVGVVVSNEDPDGEHRIRVKMPLVNNDDDGTWARVAVLDAGEERGFFFRPEVGDEVILGFLNDDPRQAVILGMLHSSAKPAPLEGSDDNHEKVYQSRSKMKLYFNDEKKILQLETPAGNSILLSEDEEMIKITDQNGNLIEMTSDGITIESSKALQLKAGTEITIESGTALNINGGSELKLSGASGTEVSSSATTKVKGSMVMIN